MARPEGVVTLAHRKIKGIKVHLWKRPDGTVLVHILDAIRGKVITFDEKKKS